MPESQINLNKVGAGTHTIKKFCIRLRTLP